MKNTLKSIKCNKKTLGSRDIPNFSLFIYIQNEKKTILCNVSKYSYTIFIFWKWLLFKIFVIILLHLNLQSFTIKNNRITKYTCKCCTISFLPNNSVRERHVPGNELKREHNAKTTKKRREKFLGPFKGNKGMKKLR